MSSENEGGAGHAHAGDQTHGAATPGKHAHASDQSHGVTTAGKDGKNPASAAKGGGKDSSQHADGSSQHAAENKQGQPGQSVKGEEKGPAGAGKDSSQHADGNSQHAAENKQGQPGQATKGEYKAPEAAGKDASKSEAHESEHKSKDSKAEGGKLGELHKDIDAKKIEHPDHKASGKSAHETESHGKTTAGLGGHTESSAKAALELDISIASKNSKPKTSKNNQGQGGQGGQINRPSDHQGGFNFRVELGGVQAGAFRSVEGLAVSVELIEYQGGGDKYARQIPGRPKVAPITLKKGYVNTATLWDWMKGTMEGKIQFENVSVILLDDDGQEELARYNLLETWPSSWKGWQLDANASNAMVEELELQVRQVERVA